MCPRIIISDISSNRNLAKIKIKILPIMQRVQKHMSPPPSLSLKLQIKNALWITIEKDVRLGAFTNYN